MPDDFTTPFEWTGPTFDPNDEHFGDLVENTTLEAAANYDAVLVGEPYDGGQVSVRGAALGPEGLRQGLAETKTSHLVDGPVSSVGDLGDIDIPWGRDVIETQTYIRSVAARIHEVDTFPLFMGGGHDLGYPNSASLFDLHDTVGVINFDAHADVREVVDYPYNGTPFRQAFDDGLAAYAFIGGRHFETSTPYVEYMRERDCPIIPAEVVGDDPVSAVETALSGMDGVDAIHVSCDLDVLDMTAAPGTTAPTPGGLTTRELYRCLRLVAADPRVVSFDLIGCAPPLDTGVQRLRGTNIGPTAIAGSRALAHVMSAVEAR
jgi:formimidoylglutamase